VICFSIGYLPDSAGISCSEPFGVQLEYAESSAARMLPRLEEDVFLLSPRRTHPVWLVVVALVSTGIGSISEMLNREGHLKATVILSKFLQVAHDVVHYGSCKRTNLPEKQQR